MRLLVIGETGQLARALRREGEALGHAVTTLDRGALDLAWDDARIEAALRPHLQDADAVILAAAYTAVDAAEEDSETAHAVNAAAPGTVARACAAAGLALVHISTDYVFDGEGREPFPTDHPTAPLGVYGRTKRDGEVAVLDSGANAAILRTSWVFDGTNKNFLTTMLRLAETRDALTVVADQIGRPTYAGHLARASLRVAQVLRDGKTGLGIFHVSGSGEPVSWADFAKAIFEASGKTVAVTPIPSSDYPTPAARPHWSVMSLDAFERTFGYDLPDWRDGLRAALDERAA